MSSTRPQEPLVYFMRGLTHRGSLAPEALREWVVVGAEHLYGQGATSTELRALHASLWYTWSRRRNDSAKELGDVHHLLRSACYQAPGAAGDFGLDGLAYSTKILEIEALLIHIQKVAEFMETLERMASAAQAS